MLYLIYGKDTIKSRRKLHELLDWAKNKRPKSELFKINSENFSESQIEELLHSQGLFDLKYTVVLDNLFEKKDVKDFILERLEEISKSEQLFFMLEAQIDSPTLKKIEKYAKQVQGFDLKEDKKTEYNVFSVTSGLLSRDRKKLWISFLECLTNNFGPEEIHGIFFWQVKNMILASKSKSQIEAGLTPFAYTNALRGARKYKTEELINMSNDLVEMTHKVRTGKGDLDIMLEKWALGV
jgi:DNA polymerase III delta subunit